MRQIVGLMLLVVLTPAIVAAAPTTGSLSNLGLGASVYEVNENDGAAEIIVHRSGGDEYAVDLYFDIAPGSATEPASYISPVMKAVSWAAHDSSDRTIMIPLVNNTLSEGSKSFSITLTNTNPEAQLNGITTATITIIDDEHVYLSLIPTEISVVETAPYAYFSGLRGGSSVGVASAEYALYPSSSTDYSLTGDQLLWGDGEVDPVQVSIGIVDDTLSEGDESILIELHSPSAGASITDPYQSLLTIIDDDSRLVYFQSASYSIAEAGPTITVTVARSNVSVHPDHAISVQVQTANGSAQAGSDYQSHSEILTWTDSDLSSRSVTINLIDDSFSEGDESFTVSLSNPQGCKLGPIDQTTVIIVDDEWGELDLGIDTTNIQWHPAVASDDAGNFVVVWHSNHTDFSNWGVYGRRFDHNGSPLIGPDVTLQEDLNSGHGEPAVAMNASGMHVVAWIGEGDGTTKVIARLFDAQGSLIKTVKPQYNADGTPLEPGVAIDDIGNFMVVWQDLHGEQSILARVYDRFGNPYAEDFAVSAIAREENDNPAVAALPGGGFLVVWDHECWYSCLPAMNQTAVMGARYSSTGGYITNFLLNDGYTWNLKPRAAANADGFAVVWQQKRETSDGWDILKRNVLTGPIGSATTINTYLVGDQTSPAVSVDADGTVVVWESDGQDGSQLGVFARDLEQASEQQINRNTVKDQYQPDITYLINGKYFVVWLDEQSFLSDIRGAIWIPE